MQRRALLGSIAVGSVAAVAGCSASVFGNRVEETREREFDPGDGAAVSLDTQNGDVAVETHDGDRVVVEARVSAPSGGRLADVSLTSDASDGEFTVMARVDGGWNRVSVDLDARVPADTPVDSVVTQNGDVDVRDVASVSAARSSNGDVTVRDVGQTGSVGTENGDVEAEIPAPLPGDVHVESTNGDADAWLSPAVDAELWATTENGEVTVSGLKLNDSRVAENEVRGVLGDGTDEVTVTSENGDVTVEALD
jgi:hypothetical protein